MRRVLTVILIALLVIPAAQARVIRPSPNILWVDSSGKAKAFSAFRGQPVIVLIAPSPRTWAFRAQVGQLQKMYQRLAADQVVCLAAFTSESGVIRSNIPFAIAADGPRAAADFDITGPLGVAIIGRDGNLDYVTDRVVPVQKIYDIIGASFVTQELLRRR